MAQTQDAFELLGEGPFMGTIKTTGAKYGFLSCDVTERQFSRDVFYMNNGQLPPGLAPGMRVLFNLSPNEKGEPQGTKLEAIVTQQSPMAPAPQALPQQNAVKEPLSKQTPPGKIFKGSVKSISEKGHGWVQCLEVQQMYGRDAYLDKEELELGLEEGQEVNFVVSLNDRGQPHGKIIQGQFIGILKTFNENTGFGFIECAEASRCFNNADVFIHKNEVKNCADGVVEIGETVSFELTMNKKGQPQAQGVRKRAGYDVGGYEPIAKKPDANIIQGEFTGTLKSYNENSGFGFIDCPEASRCFNNADVFIHKNEVDKNSAVGGIAVGDTVSFEVTMNKKGQPQAQGVKKRSYDQTGYDVGEYEPIAKKQRVFSGNGMAA